MTSRPHRVVVAIDASPASLAACRAAAAIASARDAELVGVFVEDAELLRLAKRSGQREIDVYSARSRQLDPVELEAQLRVRAAQSRRAFELIARGAGLESSFRVVRGPVADALRTAAVGADLVTVGLVGWSLAGRRHIGSTVRALIARGRGRLLVLQADRKLSGAIRVVLEPSAPVDELVDATVGLASRNGGEIELAVLAPDEATGSGLAERARTALAARGVASRTRWLGAPDDHDLAALAAGAGVLVMSATGSVFRADQLASLSIPLLLVFPDER